MRQRLSVRQPRVAEPALPARLDLDAVLSVLHRRLDLPAAEQVRLRAGAPELTPGERQLLQLVAPSTDSPPDWLVRPDAWNRPDDQNSWRRLFLTAETPDLDRLLTLYDDQATGLPDDVECQSALMQATAEEVRSAQIRGVVDQRRFEIICTLPIAVRVHAGVREGDYLGLIRSSLDRSQELALELLDRARCMLPGEQLVRLLDELVQDARLPADLLADMWAEQQMSGQRIASSRLAQAFTARSFLPRPLTEQERDGLSCDDLLLVCDGLLPDTQIRQVVDEERLQAHRELELDDAVALHDHAIGFICQVDTGDIDALLDLSDDRAFAGFDQLYAVWRTHLLPARITAWLANGQAELPVIPVTEQLQLATGWVSARTGLLNMECCQALGRLRLPISPFLLLMIVRDVLAASGLQRTTPQLESNAMRRLLLGDYSQPLGLDGEPTRDGDRLLACTLERSLLARSTLRSLAAGPPDEERLQGLLRRVRGERFQISRPTQPIDLDSLPVDLRTRAFLAQLVQRLTGFEARVEKDFVRRKEVSHALRHNARLELEEERMNELRGSALLWQYYSAFKYRMDEIYSGSQAKLSGEVRSNSTGHKLNFGVIADAIPDFMGLKSGLLLLVAPVILVLRARSNTQADRLIHLANGSDEFALLMSKTALFVLSNESKRAQLRRELAREEGALAVVRGVRAQFSGLRRARFDGTVRRLAMLDAQMLVDLVMNGELDLESVEQVARMGVDGLASKLGTLLIQKTVLEKMEGVDRGDGSLGVMVQGVVRATHHAIGTGMRGVSSVNGII